MSARRRVALALRAAAPIYATGETLSRLEPAHPHPEAPSVAAWLEQVRPGDFVTPSRGGDSEGA